MEEDFDNSVGGRASVAIQDLNPEELVTKTVEQAEKERVRYISLQFTDVVGVVKNVSIPIERLEEAVRYGVWFDGSSIEGFARIAESDMFLVPDLSTFSVLPWERGENTTAVFDHGQRGRHALAQETHGYGRYGRVQRWQREDAKRRQSVHSGRRKGNHVEDETNTAHADLLSIRGLQKRRDVNLVGYVRDAHS